MFAYYLNLGLRSLTRNMILTALMIAAIAVGIGASMTTLTVFRAMSGNPIPQKSRQLYAPQIDNWGADQHTSGGSPDGLESQLSYIDVTALMKAHVAKRQSGMYAASLWLRSADPKQKPSKVQARAAYRDFFPMFDVPFEYGGPWVSADDENRSAVVVISKEINDKLFGGGNSVGKTLRLDNDTYTVSGVLDDWRPVPRFYDLNMNPFGNVDAVFLPFTRAIDKQIHGIGSNSCIGGDSGWEGRLRSECIWLQYWVELPTAADAQKYRAYLGNYATEQERLGRFHWPAHTQLRDVSQWLHYQHVVPNEVRILILVSFGFLLVCLMNAMGLMLAKILGRAGDIGVRRALGASRGAIFAQCLIETGVVGLAGGILGLALTALGLWATRSLLTKDFSALAHLDFADTAIAVSLAVAATILAGLYPTWRAAHVQPAWQLKAR